MKIIENNLEFDFADANETIKFDSDKHGLSQCMKAVDFIIDLDEAYLFIEVKDPKNPSAKAKQVKKFYNKITNGELCYDLVKKFRDSFLYRWAENKLDKPVYYLVLITIEEELLAPLSDSLKRELPISGSNSWSRNLVKTCLILNIDSWTRNFPKWKVNRINNT